MSTKVVRAARWPAADRAAWAAAFDEGDIFDGRGPAAHWSAGSRCSVASGYGRWIGYLQAVEPAALAAPPAERVTRERIRRYIDHLSAEITPAGVFNYAKHLYDAIRVMAAEQDWTWLKTLVWRLSDKVVHRPKRHRMVDPERLLRLARKLMRAAQSGALTLETAASYRDGLIIGFLTFHPIRRRNLAAMRIGQHLQQIGSGWFVVFGEHETKNHRPLEFRLADRLVPLLGDYLDRIRPLFPGADTHAGLWASVKGCPLQGQWIYARVCRLTQEAFGEPINLHLFRDIAATTIATRDPTRVGIARDLLGHSDLRSIDKHYNQACQIQAGRAYHQALLAERNDLAQTGRKRTPRS